MAPPSPRTRQAPRPVTPKAFALREQQIRAAMAELIRQPAFGHFIDAVREQREAAILDSLNDTVAASERLSLVSKGEIRCYTSIISVYDEWYAKLQAESGVNDPSVIS